MSYERLVPRAYPEFTGQALLDCPYKISHFIETRDTVVFAPIILLISGRLTELIQSFFD
jgi:hypothetical protein